MSQGFSFKEATAPVAPASSGGFSFEDAISVKQPKLAAEPETPSFPVGTMGGFEEAIAPIDRRSILDRPVPMPPAPPQDELLGINPQMVRAIKAQLDAAPPEKRQAMIAKLQNRGGVYGRIASSIASQYETIDRLPEKYRFVPQDFRSEVQAARFMAREGMTPEAAQSAAISQALIQAPLELTQATPLTEAQAAGERFKFEPGMAPIEETLLAIGRVGAKGGAAILQGTGGVIRFLGDAAGMDTRDTTKTLNTLNTFTQSMGEAKYKPLQIIEDAGTSILQQLPALVGGAITGSQPLVLGSMFITSFGQIYDDSRRRKLDIGDATARAAMFAALEVIGEKFGLGDVLKGIKASAQGKPTAELANYFAKALVKEVPGEQLTYAGQFAVDKGFGLNPEAGFEEFFKGAADTLAVTLAQGGMMMGGGAAISKASQKINQIVGRPPEQSFDYEALAKAKGFLAEQAPPPERPPAAPPVEPKAPAPIVTEAAPPVQPTARRVEEEEFETLPPTEVPETPPEAPMAAQPVEPPAVERTPASFAADIAAGKKLETPEDIQFYQNNAKEIEDELTKLTATEPTAPQTQTPAAAELPETPTVAPVIKPKTVEPPAPQHMDAEHPVVEIPVSDLKLSEEVPQFKYGANKKGVVQPLGGTFTKEGVAPIAVWQRLDGSLEVISGRHRFELAQRSGTKVIPSQIYYESQGFTAVDAAIKDAELNIRDEQGKVKDYVNYFKESGIDRDTAESKGFLARDKGKRGFTIANQGSDELIDALRADQVGDEAAYYIALNAPGDARLQSVGIKAIMDGKSMNVATNTMQAVKALASENDTTTDMFGFDDSAIKEAEAMARIASQKQREIQTRLSAISGAAKNPAVAKAEGIDIRNPEQVNRRIEELRSKKAAWDNWSTNPTLIAEIRAARGVEAPTLAPREEPVLTTQTKEELQEKERREREIEERKRQEELEAKRKEEADKEREGFVLTGSDREADEAAARGQEDMFAAPPAPEAPSPDATVEKYVNKLTKEGNELEAYETTEDNLYRTRTFEWSGDISRKDFDALTLKAEKSDLKRGNKYSILLADTNVESSSLTFFVPSIQPTQQKISVRMQLQQTKLVEQPPAKKPSAPAPAPEAKTLPSFSKSVDELTPEEREAEVRFIRSELSTLNKKYIKSENEQEEQELEKIIDPLQERLNRLTKKGRLVEQKKKKEVSEATKVADEYETPMEVANGKTPDPALPPANRLILMPCSDMKGKTAAPAIDLYRGVFFQTLKTHAKDGKMPNVVILSAKHGIMNSNQIVEPYDQKMTPEQANILIASLDSQLRGLNIKNIDDVLIVGGKEYKKVMRLAVRKLLENGVINPEASINETTGELGEQRKQLREYMEAIQIAPVVEEKVEPVVEEKVVEEKKDYTPEQREEAQVHADETGGEVVWQKGDYALIRGYSILSGDPVYVPTMGSSRARTDIENFTGKQISDDIKKEMIEAKKRLEKEAEIKHENKPFIVFDKGVSISKDISPELAGVVQGWKNLLNLNVDVYVSTIDDAKANRNNFTGPHRRVGSGTLDANERGSMRRMSDGSYYILFDKSTSTTRMLEVIAHEMGHLHQRLFYDRASPEEKQALQEAHLKWVEKQKGKSAKELVEALRARTTAQTTPMPVEQRADELSSYWTSFGEWYADQTSRWALSKEQPVGIVEKFFKRLGNQLRLFYQRLQNQKWLPDETFAQYIEKTVQKPIITQTQIQEGRDIDKASKMSSIDESAFDFGDEKVVKEIVKRSPLDSKALSKASELPGAVKKLPAGRSPELAAAAQQVLEGRMSKAEFDTLVNKYRPIHLFAAVPAPATDERVVFALSSDKKPYTNPEIDPGTEVGLRLDIPAFTRHNVMVVAIHEKRTPSSAGRSIGYTSAAVIRNVTFGLGNQKETLKIAAGKAKDALQTMEGKYVESTPSETYELAKEVFSNPQWIQIGFDPTRHSYFWDRRTTMPVVKADVVIQIGNFILAKNPNYATKEEFLFNIDSGQIDLFGGGKEDKKEVPVVKRGRVPELTEAAEQLSRGEITKEQFDAKVRQFSPVKAYAEPPQPATDQQVEGAVDASKQQYANVNIPTGTRVGVRLDIPAWEKRQTWVVSIHSPKPNITSPKASKVLSYRSVAKLKNVVFAVGDQKRSLRIAAGEFKDKLQTIEGEYVNITPEEAYRTAQKLINDPSYIQVGFNPLRHAYFYDRSTMQPVVKADEILQIGNFILAKNPTYGKSEDFVFDIIGSPTKIYKPGTEVRKATRLERIQILANLRAARTRLVKKVIAGEATIDTQRRLTELESLGKDIKQMLDMTKEPSTTPEAFLSRALKAYDDGDISADVLAVIQAAYIKQPELLNGLRLSVRKPGERETGAAGTFQTMARIVTLFKGTRGVEFPGTIRHELSHSLEQMMTAKQRKVVFDAWMKAFEKAIKTNTDQKAQAYFEAVIAYMDDPTEAKFKAAAKLLPSMDLYQFISPSEYWAVNAEPLMRQQLGSAWDRFKMAVRRLFEGLKAVFGFDNTYYVHKVFAQVMGGSKERLDRKSINASLISSSGISFDTLRDLDDVQDLIDKYNRPKTPMIDQTPVKTFLVKQKEASKEFIQEAVQDPAGAINTLFDGMNRQLLNARNKNVWYGTAINAADTLRYNNSLRTSNDLATSSLALDNAIRGGHISAEVVFLGGLEFNDNSLMYTAVKRDLGMVGVYKAEKEIKDRLGDQLGTDLIQGYLEAKRSRSIENEFIFRANELEEMTARLDIAREDLASARKRKDQELVEALEKEVLARNEDVKQARADLDAIEIARGKINMSEEEIDEFISMDVDHPELRDILKNFNAVNQNLLRVWREVGLLSQARYEALSNIKDYVPWNRIMSDEDDLHSPVQATTRSRANIAKEKLFKKGKPTVITSFTVKEGEQVYRIQPTSTLQVTLNGEVLSPELYDAEVNGKVTINVPLQDGDDLVFEGNREIENIIDNMTRSVMRMTMNAVSKYAANTIVREYATRDAEGKIRTYPKPEQERGRFYFIVNGRRVVVEIRDPLLAEAIFGMRNVDLAMIKPLQAAANMTRRFITTDPMFQLFQLFKDAPLAGLISGVKNPFIVYANVFASFAKALVSPTVVAATKKLPGGPIEVAETMRILRAAGIGGYYQQSRTAEAEVKRRIGIMNNNVLSWIGKALDHIGDASDYAQRMAIYDRIMSETGDEALALYQAANVLNFLRHGSGQIAQILVKTVPFANAYANSTDVLFQAMAGGGLKGRSRKASIALFFSYGSLLAATTLLYVMLVGDDEEYLKLDDQTKLRHYIIPGTDIKLPMNTSAAFFFKALPEALYNAYINAATKDETDAKRLRTALKEAAADMLLGPEPVPSAIKPFVEIGLNRNFFTGRNVVPKNLEDVEAAEQYLGTTSEAGKFLSSLTGTDKTRLLNPIEADHIIRGLFGSVGAMAQWASNVLTDAAEAKPTPEKKDLPMVGRLFLPEVARGHEEWFYNFKKDVDKVWNTYQLKVKREKYDEAEAYLEQNEETLKYHASVMMLSEQLQKINASIKYFETSVDKDLKPDERREEINEAKRLKQEVLEDIAKMRKDHELEVEEAEKERKKAK